VELIGPAGPEPREVQLGAVGVEAVEIRGGVTDGDAVVRSVRRP